MPYCRRPVQFIKRAFLRHLYSYLFVLCLWLPFQVQAQAAAVCPQGHGQRLPDSLAGLQALSQSLENQQSACAKDAGFLAWQGAVFNAMGLHQQAADRLELALLMRPDFLGAKIDYAVAIAALGDRKAARQLFDDLLAQTDLPAPLRPLMTQQRQTWDVSDWQWRGGVAFRVGRDSNLNSAPSASEITLTVPGGQFSLPLADDFQVKSGMVALFDFYGEGARPLDQGATLHVYGSLRQRLSPSEDNSQYRQMDAGVTLQTPVDSARRHFYSVETGLLSNRDTALYQSLRLSAQREWQDWACLPRLGGELEWRRYPDTPELDGHFVGVGLNLACQIAAHPLSVALRLGRDVAVSASRPGGDQWRMDARAGTVLPWRGGRLEADVFLNHQRDDTGYSELIENNRARRYTRLGLRLEYSHPLPESEWEALANLESSRQWSNLSLFSNQGTALYLGLRRFF